MAHLRVETAVRDGSAVVMLSGELDMAGAEVLETELARLQRDRVDAVVVDLRGVEFMDSSGLRIVAVADHRAREDGRGFALVPGGAQVMRVFDITRMRERLHFVEDPREVIGRKMRFEVDLGCDPDSASEARRALGEVYHQLSPQRLEDARLLVSELVTNAVRHAGLEDAEVIKLIVSSAERGLRIEVCDPGSGFDMTEPRPDPAQPSGWGLYLVSELSDRWGVERTDQTSVWFELDR